MNVQEYLDLKGWKKAEFARLCGFKNRQNVDAMIRHGWSLRDAKRKEKRILKIDAFWYRGDKSQMIRFDQDELAKIKARQAK